MLFEGKQADFESELHEKIWAIGRQIVPFEISTAEFTDKETLEGLRQVYDFTVKFFSNLYGNPDKYKLTGITSYSGEERSLTYFHDYIWTLIRCKKIQLIGDVYIVKMSELTKSMLKDFYNVLDLLEPMGISNDTDDGISTIRSSKYPLFLKYFYMCCEESFKKKLNSFEYVVFCDFRIFNKRYSMTIDETMRPLSETNKLLAMEVHNHLVSKGIKPDLKRFHTIDYPYKKQRAMRIDAQDTMNLRFIIYFGNNPYEKHFRFMLSEMENIPNTDIIITYISNNLQRCTLCYGKKKTTCWPQWTDLFGEQPFTCGFRLDMRRKPFLNNYDNDYDLKMLMQIIDLQIKAIDNLTP